MAKTKEIKFYSPLEERINVVSHACGFLLSFVALIFLAENAILHGNVWHIVSFSIFGLSLMTLYAASTLYHNSKDPITRGRLKIFDHASIYVLIAGSYTPYTLVTLHGTNGWVFFVITWGFALTGVILKLFFTGRFKLVSTLMYVFMGWIIMFAIRPLVHNLSSEGLYWLFLGGIAYTVGAVIYAIKQIKFNHAIFHILVLIGSFCHFISIYYYVLVQNVK